MRLIFSFLIFLPLVAFSQEKATFYLEFNDLSIEETLDILEETFDVKFSYQNRFLDEERISILRKEWSLQDILDRISETSNLYFEILDSRYIIITPKPLNTERLQQLNDVVIIGYLTEGIEKNKDATFDIYPNRLQILPGLTNPDVLESIQQLPGVVSPNETASNFSVRGGSFDQNRLIWDGINMYHKGHLFGLISPFNPNVTQQVTFINKGTHARYGERTSSVINIMSSNEIADEINAEIGFDAINADAVLNLPIINDKLSVHASIRRSYADFYQTYTFKQAIDKVFQGTKIKDLDSDENNFNFLDYTLKLNYKLNSNNVFHASIINITNDLDYFTNSIDNVEIYYNDQLAIKNTGYSLSWDKKWSKNVQMVTQAYFSDYSLNYNFKTFEQQQLQSDFDKRNVIFDSGISTELTITDSKKNYLSVGYQYVFKDVGYAFINKSNVSIVLDSDESQLTTHSLYGSYTYKNPKIFDATFGLRSTYFKELEAFRLEPRLVLFKPITKHLSAQLSGEIKNQTISEIDETVLSDLSLENKLWRLSDGNNFPIIKSNQVSLGFMYKNKGWTVDIDTYLKHINNITALSLGFLNPENSGFKLGKRKIYGIDFLLKKEIHDFKVWLGYTYNDVKSKYNGINNNEYFPANTNIKHTVTTSVTYTKSKFQVALGWKWLSGKPYTVGTNTADGVVFNEGVNSENLPNYHRLDLSSTYDFNFSPQGKLKGKIGLSIRNVFDRENHISKEYSGNNTVNDPIVVVDKYSIGFTPNLLFRLYW